jgi:hypothetical protein
VKRSAKACPVTWHRGSIASAVAANCSKSVF